MPSSDIESTNLGRYVERVALLCVELCGVQNDCDLPLQHDEHHRVLVCTAHPLGAVTLDSENQK